ncbi:MAG: pyridoxal phosphate-dependent aminotransferase, partial [Polyangiaceae bacterium]
MFSSRASIDLSLNRIALALASARDDGRSILDLTVSNPTQAAIPYDESAILSALALPASLVYEPCPFGLPAAREAVALEVSTHGPILDASRIVLTSSTSEAYS